MPETESALPSAALMTLYGVGECIAANASIKTLKVAKSATIGCAAIQRSSCSERVLTPRTVAPSGYAIERLVKTVGSLES